MTLLRVNVGGLDFFGHRGPFAIGKDGFTGWDDQTYRKDSTARPNSHGNFPAPSYREAKTVNLNGHIIADGADQLNHFMDRFNGILTEGGTGKLTVQRPWGARWAPVASIVSRKALEVGGLTRGTFALVLQIDDPCKYGKRNSPVAKPGEPTYLVQRGNADAWAVITVAGSMPLGYTVKIGSTLIDVSAPLVSGAPHTIDMAMRRLKVGGAWEYQSLHATTFPPVKPGPRQSFSLTPFEGGTGSATAVFYDTYS